MDNIASNSKVSLNPRNKMSSVFLIFLSIFIIVVSSKKTDVNFCKTRRDGVYFIHEEACSQEYYECLGNRTFLRTCPEKLFYRQEAERCDDKQLNPFCFQDRVGEDNGRYRLNVVEFCSVRGNGKYKVKVGKNGLEKGGNRYTDPILCKSSDEFKYQLKFPGRCTEIYWQCVHGRAYMMSCPYGLKFNVKSNACDHEELVEDCKEYPSKEWLTFGKGEKGTIRCSNGRFVGK